ncbi:hypothetical protein [Streptomyces sp. BE147]|uniref:hypothetical protein n=1 Tax=unclassified Streptomyces TaxID=2593676 RepID=UPI002E77E6D0|nr:hypothetical protein [Streptomyces sp. BE147]MEE1739836.1 hypothetical protein [Streptomyces sp. BE147]
MSEFLDAAFGFPASLFSAALVVVVAFWLLVLFGAAEHDSFEGDLPGTALGIADGVPVTVGASLMTGIAWFTGLAGTLALHRAGLAGPVHAALAAGVLLGSLLLSWWLTRQLVRPLARLFPDEPGPSREDFIGRTCTIRTGRVDGAFGQAEVAATDGSTALVQVRRLGEDLAATLTRGSTGLLYAYDDDGEFFWVAPYDAALDPRTAA